MKKILLCLLITGFTCSCANATFEVKYNNAGTPINVAPAFGQNAAFTPQNRQMAGERNRQIKHENQYYNGLEKGNTVNVNINNSNDSSDETVKKDPTKRTYLKDKFKKVKSSDD